MSDAPAADSPSPRPPRNAVGRLFRSLSRQIASTAQLIDKDVHRHLAELPLLGLSTLVGSTKLGRRRPHAHPLPDDGHHPVIFVHGLGGHHGNFLLPRLHLWMHGRSRTYAVAFAPKIGMETMAEALSRMIDDVLAVNGLSGDAQVDLVAHSMGGIIARLALEDPQTRKRVGTLVTLGTPHAGTHAARWWSSKNLRALRPESDVMHRLEKQLPWSGQPRLFSFWSKSDVFLLPATTACVEGAINVEIPKLTHYGYLLRLGVFQKLEEALRDGAGSLVTHPAAG